MTRNFIYWGISQEGATKVHDDLEKIIKPEVFKYQAKNFVSFCIRRAELINIETFQNGLNHPDQCRLKVAGDWTISGIDEELTVTGMVFSKPGEDPGVTGLFWIESEDNT